MQGSHPLVRRSISAACCAVALLASLLPLVATFQTARAESFFTETVGFATKTGHRGVFAWASNEPVTAEVHYGTSPDDLDQTTAPNPGAIADTAGMAFAELTEGETYYWQVVDLDSGERSAIQSFETKNAFKDWDGDVYTIDMVLQLDSESLDPEITYDLALDNIAQGMNVFAERVYDATDGFVRVGNVLVTDTNLDYAVQVPEGLVCVDPVDSNLADVLVTTNKPFDSHTFRGGIEDPCTGFYVGRIGQLVNPWGFVTDQDLHFGYVSAHELAHYALFAPDLYPDAPNGGGGDCRNLDWDGSLMHNSGGWEGKWILSEFDRNPALTPCVHGTNDYTWDMMRGDLDRNNVPDNPANPLYINIPLRPNGPIEHIFDERARGNEDGGALDIHVLDRDEVNSASTLTRYIPFDGTVTCGLGAPVVTDRQGDATSFVLETGVVPSNPSLDVLSANLTWNRSTETVTFHIHVDDLTEGPPPGATGKHYRFDFAYAGARFEATATDDLTQGQSFELAYFGEADTDVTTQALTTLTGAFDFEGDEVRIDLPVALFNSAVATEFGSLDPPRPIPPTMAEESKLEGFQINAQRIFSTPAGSITPTADSASGTCPYVIGEEIEPTGEPIARDDSVTTDENVAVDIAVLANDIDTSGDELHVASLTQPSNGTAVLNPDQTITYTPTSEFDGTDTFTYVAADPGGLTDTATVDVTVVPFQCPVTPTGTFTEDVESGDDGWAYEDASLRIGPAPPSSGVTWGPTPDPNASSPETSFFSDAMGIAKDDRLISPEFDLSDASELTFQHRFAFEPEDPQSGDFYDGGVLEATLDGGLAWSDVLELGATFTQGGYNARLIEGETRVLSGREAWAGVGSTGMSIVAVDVGALAGEDVRFRWRLVTDDTVGNTGWFVDDIEVTALSEHPETCNSPPRAQPDFTHTVEEVEVEVDVLANDTDPDDDELTVSAFDAHTAENGSVSDEGDGVLRYVPPDAFSGTDTFSYTASDPSGETSEALVTITVAANSPPDAANDEATSPAGQSVTIDLLANDSDADGDDIEIASIDSTSAEGGSVADNGDGTATYTPASGFRGADSFAYTISDEHGKTDGAIVSITVTNSAPVATDDTATAVEGTTIEISVLDNDTDPNGDSLSVSAAQSPTEDGGTTAIGSGGVISYTAPSSPGVDHFTYTVSDGHGGTDEGSVEVTVTEEPNTPPVAVDDTSSVAEGGTVVIDVLANDTDADGDTLTLQSVSSPTEDGGTASVVSGEVSYTAPETPGTDHFTYTVSDGRGGTDEGSVSVEVTETENSPPVAVDDDATVADGESITISVLANDTDADDDALSLETVDATGTSLGGVVTDNGDGTVTYAAPDDVSGADGFDYSVSDGRGGTDEGHVTVTVTRRSTSCAINAHGDFKLRRDYDDCTGDGIVVDDEHTTVSLNGHTISGIGAPGSVGIRNARYGKVTIVGPGVVEGFDVGILLGPRATGSRIQNLTVRLNEGEGLVVGATKAKVTGTTVNDNGSTGIVVSGKQPVIDGNTALRNGGDGIDATVPASKKARARVTNNAVHDNTLYGIVVISSRYVQTANNTATGNNGGGAQCSPAEACT